MNIADFITSACLVEDYDTVRDGSFRLATPFRYPDGSHIDVFLKDGGTVFDGFELSDKGQTVAYLLDLHVNPWSSQRCKQGGVGHLHHARSGTGRRCFSDPPFDWKNE